MNRLEIAIKKAENALIKADSALQGISKHIKYIGFSDNDEPEISSCNGSHEIILEWHGRELDANQIIYNMNTKGNIEPSDFIGM